MKYIEATCGANALGFQAVYFAQVVAFLGWVVFGMTACAILYGLYPSFSDLSTPIYADMLDNKTATSYNAVSRPLWTVCLAWVVIACTNGYGGWLMMWCLASYQHWVPENREFLATPSLFMCLVTYAIGWITGIISKHSRVNSLSGCYIKSGML